MLTKYVLADRGQRHDLVWEEMEPDILILKKTPHSYIAEISL